MHPEQDQFQELRRLLTLKRYEQPPPGYFEHFSREVIVRIRAGERGEPAAAWHFLSWEAPWLRRIWAALEAKPLLAGSFGVAICGFLVAGMMYSEPSESGGFPSGSPLASISNPDQHHALTVSTVPGLTPVLQNGAAPSLPGLQGVAPVSASDSLFQQVNGGANVRLINVAVPQ